MPDAGDAAHECPARDLAPAPCKSPSRGRSPCTACSWATVHRRGMAQGCRRLPAPQSAADRRLDTAACQAAAVAAESEQAATLPPRSFVQMKHNLLGTCTWSSVTIDDETHTAMRPDGCMQKRCVRMCAIYVLGKSRSITWCCRSGRQPSSCRCHRVRPSPPRAHPEATAAAVCGWSRRRAACTVWHWHYATNDTLFLPRTFWSGNIDYQQAQLSAAEQTAGRAR